MNYFFVHTPFQLIVAQGLIKQNNLKENVIFLGHTGRNIKSQHQVLNDILIITLWNKVYEIGDLHDYIPRLSCPFSFLKARKALNKIDEQIKTKDAKLYFGDINNIAYIFMIKFLKIEGVFFFEEGSSHYNMKLLQPKANACFIKGFLYNFLSRQLVSVDSISRFIFNKKPSFFNFKIYKRYNILNREENEPFDEAIDLRTILEQGVNDKFIKRLDEFKMNESPVIFLSSTIRHLFDDGIEVEVNIVDKISKIYPSAHVFIKFHPKDEFNLKQKIINILKKKNINASEWVIPNEVPIEVLYDKMSPKAFFGYGSSAQLYFTKFSKIIPNRNVLELLDDEYIDRQKQGSRIKEIVSNWQILKTNQE